MSSARFWRVSRQVSLSLHNKIIILVFVNMTNLMITVAIMVIIVVIIVVMIAGRQAGNSTILNLVSELGHTRYLFDADGAVVDDNEDTVDDVGDTFDDKWLVHFYHFFNQTCTACIQTTTSCLA